MLLVSRSPLSDATLLGQLLALVSDLPQGDWWSNKYSARDLYNELPPTEVRKAEPTVFIVLLIL